MPMPMQRKRTHIVHHPKMITNPMRMHRWALEMRTKPKIVLDVACHAIERMHRRRVHCVTVAIIIGGIHHTSIRTIHIHTGPYTHTHWYYETHKKMLVSQIMRKSELQRFSNDLSPAFSIHFIRNLYGHSRTFIRFQNIKTTKALNISNTNQNYAHKNSNSTIPTSSLSIFLCWMRVRMCVSNSLVWQSQIF